MSKIWTPGAEMSEMPKQIYFVGEVFYASD